MSAFYLSYSGFVGGDHFVFASKCMKNDVWLFFNAVPMDPPALEPNNLTVADSDNYPSVTSLLTSLGITERRGMCWRRQRFNVGRRTSVGFGVEVWSIELMHVLIALDIICLWVCLCVCVCVCVCIYIYIYNVHIFMKCTDFVTCFHQD